jgi:hypothetical protein
MAAMVRRGDLAQRKQLQIASRIMPQALPLAATTAGLGGPPPILGATSVCTFRVSSAATAQARVTSLACDLQTCVVSDGMYAN